MLAVRLSARRICLCPGARRTPFWGYKRLVHNDDGIGGSVPSSPDLSAFDNSNGISGFPPNVTPGADSLSDATVETSIDVTMADVVTPVLGNMPPDYVLSGLQWVLETTHVPAWAVIVGGSLLFRMALFPLQKKGVIVTQQLSKMKPLIDAVNKQQKEDPRGQEQERKEMYMNQIMRIMKENGGSPWRAMVLPVVQMPIFISMFFALRKAGDFIPAMKTGGLWWFTDLTAPDPTVALPVLMSLSLIGLAEIQDTTDKVAKMKARAMMRGMSVIMLPLTAKEPSGVFVFWISSNIASAVTSLILRDERSRAYFGMPPKPAVNPIIAKQQAAPSPLVRVLGGNNPLRAVKELLEEQKSLDKKRDVEVYGDRWKGMNQNLHHSSLSKSQGDGSMVVKRGLADEQQQQQPPRQRLGSKPKLYKGKNRAKSAAARRRK